MVSNQETVNVLYKQKERLDVERCNPLLYNKLLFPKFPRLRFAV
jgi:hypothetical protein